MDPKSMDGNPVNPYDIDPHIAEIYDQYETQTDDIALIRRWIRELPPACDPSGGPGPLRILEPFCGTGRILIPLARDGHVLVGLDQAAAMLERARRKIRDLPPAVQARITLGEADLAQAHWPRGFDLVVIGSNTLYELATAEIQARVIAQAAASLKPGGYLYVDNDHMEGELDASWQDVGVVTPSLRGTCADGTRVETTRETLWIDVPNRLARFRRRVIVTAPDGRRTETAYVQQKHPVSTAEVRTWLTRCGLTIEHLVGDRDAHPYTDASDRAIFWARKEA